MTTFYSTYLTIGGLITLALIIINFIVASLKLKHFDDWLTTVFLTTFAGIILFLVISFTPYIFGQHHSHLLYEKRIYPNTDKVSLALKTSTDKRPLPLTKGTFRDAINPTTITDLQLSRNNQTLA